MSDGSSSGTLARAALMTATDRSSGRTSLSEPLESPPDGGAGGGHDDCFGHGVFLLVEGGRDKRPLSHRRWYAVIRGLPVWPWSPRGRPHAPLPPHRPRPAVSRPRRRGTPRPTGGPRSCEPARPRARPRLAARVAAHLPVLVGTAALGRAVRNGVARPAQQLGPAPTRAAGVAGDLGAADLGAGVEDRLLGRDGHRADALPATAVGQAILDRAALPDVEGGIHAWEQGGRAAGIARRRGVEAVLAEQLVRAFVELRAEEVAQRHGAAADLDDGNRLGRGEVAAPAAPHETEGLGDRGDGPEVRTGADDDLRAQLAKPDHGRLEVAHGDGLADPVGHVVGADHDDGRCGRSTCSSALVSWASRPEDSAPMTAVLVSCTGRPVRAEMPVATMAPTVW